MATYRKQLECLQCSNNRRFVVHVRGGKQELSQEQALALHSRVRLTCGRCGSTSLIAGWSESSGYPAATG